MLFLIDDAWKGFLKSEYSRDFHYEEIQEKIQNNPDLMALFSQEMRRVQARKYRKKLKEIGIKEGWFAIIEGIIIAGKQYQKEVENSEFASPNGEEESRPYIPP